MTVKQGDTHEVGWTITDRKTKLPRDLTGATAVVHVRLQKPKGSPAITLPATIGIPPTSGIVLHQLTGTLAAGEYDVEIEVTQAGDITTAPTEGFDMLIVEEALA